MWEMHHPESRGLAIAESISLLAGFYIRINV